MASIRDVAKKAKVAACTVSRVLNGSGYVAPETKERIERVMKELDYIPNELARSMFRQKVGIIAMLVPNIRHPFFSSLATSIEKELYKKGYKLMLCSTGNDIKREREYLETLKSNLVDGVIWGVSHLEDIEYKKFNKPLIMLDYFIDDSIPVVVANHAQGGKLAAEKFIQSGCKNVIHICDIKDKPVLSLKSHIALEEKLREHNINVNAVEINWNDFDFEGYLELAKKELVNNPEIDGVMAADMPAIAFLKAAIQLGKRIPEEFCVVAYDGTFIINTNVMDVTTIIQPIHLMARRAIELMMDLIDGKTVNQAMNVLDVSLKDGDTTN